MHEASGTFEVKIKPEPLSDVTKDTAISRFSIDKVYHGQLEGTSQGEMLSFGNPAKDGSAGYVSIEKVTGKIEERIGSFALQHNGTIDRGVPALDVIIIPGSGTDQLQGLAGTFTIEIASGKHSYVFSYSLPEAGSR